MIAGGAFSDGQFRRFFLGVFFAVQAIWIQRVTLAWLAWEVTGSAAFVGLVAALGLLPTLVMGPVFGVWADRVDIRRASIVTNGGMAAILALFAVTLPLVGALGVALASLAVGLMSAAHHPVRMSLGPRLVPQPLVQHVVAVTALNFNLARLAAPVAAGWLIAGAGASTALWVAVACYVPMLAVLPGLHPRDLPPRPRVSVLSDLRDGIRYAAARPLIRQALLLTLLFAAVVRGALELLPVLADGAFERGATGLGMLTSAAGVGAFAAALFKASGVGAVGARIPRAVYVACLVGSVAVVAMGASPVWPLALAAVCVAGFCATWCGVSLQSAIQSELDDAYRGRVMSLWTVVGFGTVAIGAGAIGTLAELTSIGAALILAGLAGLIAMVSVWMRGAR